MAKEQILPNVLNQQGASLLACAIIKCAIKDYYTCNSFLKRDLPKNAAPATVNYFKIERSSKKKILKNLNQFFDSDFFESLCELLRYVPSDSQLNQCRGKNNG